MLPPQPAERARRALIASAVLPLVLAAAACSGSDASIVGNWTASDGSGTKTILEDGQCTGMYYNQGQPLDIGGPMTCSMSAEANSSGLFTMVVTQAPNQTSVQLRFVDDDTVEVQGADGGSLFTMTRQ